MSVIQSEVLDAAARGAMVALVAVVLYGVWRAVARAGGLRWSAVTRRISAVSRTHAAWVAGGVSILVASLGVIAYAYHLKNSSPQRPKDGWVRLTDNPFPIDARLPAYRARTHLGEYEAMWFRVEDAKWLLYIDCRTREAAWKVGMGATPSETVETPDVRLDFSVYRPGTLEHSAAEAVCRNRREGKAR